MILGRIVKSVAAMAVLTALSWSVWRNPVLHWQYEAELADWWEQNRQAEMFTDFSFVCDQATITPSITLSAGAPTPRWVVTESDSQEYVYTTASFTHNRSAAGPMTVTLVDSWQMRPFVTAMHMEDDGITSDLADLNLHLFRRLVTASLGGNQLSGAVPADLGKMKKLSILGLTENSLTGSIPAELGNLSSLTFLILSRNQLTGSIPAELGNLSSLTYLDLLDNQLSGSIPAELGDLAALDRLRLGENQLSGAVPAELGALDNLTALELNDNQLAGVESGALGVATVEDLYLNGNGMSQAAVDGIVDDIYAARATYTGTPIARIGGSNAAPSGTYQAACPPTTGKEKIYELENDSCGDGHALWSIVYTP